MNNAGTSTNVIASQEDPATDAVVDAVAHRCEATTVGPRCPASPVRLTLASRLGNKIDGAWWPRTGLISHELSELVSILDVRLGHVVDIDVNWSSLQRQPDLNWEWWQGIRPHVMTIGGRDGRAKLLIIPYRTGTALAVMVLRRAAGLPVTAAHRESRAFRTAEGIVRVARGEPMYQTGPSRPNDSAPIPPGRAD